MKKIKICHLAKTEGHFSFEGALLRGDIATAKIITEEGARLIEGMLVGRRYLEAPIITSRICGICPVVHNLSSVKAIEDALDIKVDENTRKIRKLLEHAQIIHSHGLHLYFLSFPDFLKISNTLEVIQKTPKQAGQSLLVRDFGVQIVKEFGGRTVHVISSCVGGFKTLPNKKSYEDLIKMSEDVLRATRELIKVFAKLKYPKFERKTHYSSLTDKKEYAIYEGKMCLDKKSYSVKDYMSKIIEELDIRGEKVKRTNIKSKAYFCGSLARINNNFDKLHPEAKKAWKKLGVDLPDYNSFHNIYAQAVELLHCVLESQKILKELGKKPPKANWKKPRLKAGEGYGAVEAPRGTLLDYYKLDKNGIIRDCNIITPTAQFLANLEEDLKMYLPTIKNLSDKNREWEIKKLIRAYDPCIACATH
ncbi:MAG: Ni/Fe hydrogenase subunit alpha [Patescibacteria group bacterium]|nr:Ni/Fe hydrogenase subunit alpha [Patescibacteria group bacterium]